jgi:anti-sigma-K factor RskA
MTDHRWLEFASAYALDALAADERTAFEHHLAECAICRAEVQAHREVAGLVALAAPVPPAAPSPGLRDRILRDARRVPRIGARRGRGGGRVAPWLAAAALLVLALGLTVAYRSERAARHAATRALAAAHDTIAAGDSLVATLLAPDVGTADLAATGKAPSMRLFWNRARNVVVVAAFELAPAPAGRTYQLWAIKKGQAPVSLGTFNTAQGGRAVVSLRMPAGFRPDLSAVTEEPAGGSPQPTQQPFLVGSWQGGG